MADSPTNWELIKAILADALELPAAERGKFVSEKCSGDLALIAEVSALISGYERLDGVLDSKSDAWVGLSGPDMLALSGERVGRYTLERLLAEGASGAVYVANQTSPNRRVALKMLRTSLPMLDQAHRFKRESAALGRLRHPNIAQIYESGVHSAGQQAGTPYLAMELVDGVPLNRFVIDKKLTREERIRLMIKVVLAVHAAHQQAVIHRDLKPANVLVQNDGEPKVLDFGIARIADMEDAQTTWQTTVGVLLGTPGYMSPEQAAGDSNGVDVRSDVWSLGVLLYELLTERLPLDVKGRSLPEILRAIETTEPQPISRVDPSLRGDLETIVETAMAKDKTHRYASAEALANDLRNVLEYQPITAKKVSRWYRASKFIRRNRVAVTLTSLLAAAVLAGAIVSTTALVRERRQRNRAEAINEFLNEMISKTDPYVGDKDMTVRDVMANAEQTLGKTFSAQPEVEAELRRTIGWTFFNLSDYEPAERNLGRSVELYTQTSGPNGFETLNAKSQLVLVLSRLGKYSAAQKLADESHAAAVRVLGPDHYLSLELLERQASIFGELREMKRAEDIYKDLIPRLRRTLGENHWRLFDAQNNYGHLLVQSARYAEAEAVLEPLVGRSAAQARPDDPSNFPNRLNLLIAKMKQGKLDQSEPALRSLVSDVRRVMGENHRNTISMENDYSELLCRLGRFDESIVLQKAVVEKNRGLDGDDAFSTLKWQIFLTDRLLNASRFAEAESLLRSILPRAQQTLGNEHLASLLIEANIARSLTGLSRFSEAESVFRSVIERKFKSTEIMTDRHAELRLAFAQCLNGLGKRDEAIENLNIAQRISDAMKFYEFASRGRRERARTYLSMGRTEDAERTLLNAMESDRSQFDPRQQQKTAVALVDFYEQTNRPIDAAKWRAATQPATNPAAER